MSSLTNLTEVVEEEPHATFKIVLLGASDVGKSSLVLRFVKGKFFERRENTIGAAFLTKTIDVEGKRVKFEIWDTAGQERYHSLAPMYYRDSAGTLIIYDITCRESLSKAKNWLNELYKSGSNNMTIFFIGNKQDLSERTVETEEGKSFADEQNLTFFETSAKTNYNVDELFLTLGKKLLEKSLSSPPPAEPEVNINIAEKPPARNLDENKCAC